MVEVVVTQRPYVRVEHGWCINEKHAIQTQDGGR